MSPEEMARLAKLMPKEALKEAQEYYEALMLAAYNVRKVYGPAGLLKALRAAASMVFVDPTKISFEQLRDEVNADIVKMTETVP